MEVAKTVCLQFSLTARKYLVWWITRFSFKKFGLNPSSERDCNGWIDGFHSGLLRVKYGGPQGSILGPLISFLQKNDLNSFIRFSLLFHFVDDTSLLKIKKISTTNSIPNKDLKKLYFWLNANKFPPNVDKNQNYSF